MFISKVKNIKIEGIASCVPKKEINNHVFGKELFGDSLEGVIRATGVEKRRVCDNKNKRVTVMDLSIKAAEKLYQNQKLDKKDFGAILFVTSSPDSIMPNNATHVQHLMGFGNDLAAFDINHACAAYPYGLWVSSMIANSTQKKVLLLEGDTNSYFVSPEDKSTALLFGDAGTATIVAPTDENCEFVFGFDTDGSMRDSLYIPDFGFRNKLTEKSLEQKEYEDGSRRSGLDMKMDGKDIFDYVVQRVPKILQGFLAKEEWDISDFEYLLFHQANRYMLKQLTRKLKGDWNKVPLSINKYGNTSSASIPLNICSELSEVLEIRKQKVLMAGFGAGLATSAAILELGHCICPGVIEYE